MSGKGWAGIGKVVPVQRVPCPGGERFVLGIGPCKVRFHVRGMGGGICMVKFNTSRVMVIWDSP